MARASDIARAVRSFTLVATRASATRDATIDATSRSCRHFFATRAHALFFARARASHAKTRAPSVSRYVVTAFGVDKPGIIADLTAKVLAARGNVEESRMTNLCGDFTISMRVSFVGADAVRETLEASLSQIPSITTSVRVSSDACEESNTELKRVRLRGEDFPGITNALAKILHERGVNIERMRTDTTDAPFGAEKLFLVDAIVRVPREVCLSDSLAPLRRVVGLDVDVEEYDPMRDIKSSRAYRSLAS